jgi:1-acyl-sn-glycerol-3-phosphate acyltransferase
MIKRLTAKISDFFYSLPRTLFVGTYRLFIRIRFFNKERLPKNKSAILAINHSTDADPIIILSALKKKIYFLAESENFESWLTNFFMRKFANCVPVFKKQYIKNVKSFKELFYLANKKNVSFGIYPEGVVNKKANFIQFHKGAAYFSYKTKLPIIPIYLHNTRRAPNSNRWIWTNRITRGIISIIANTFRKINIFIGEPIDPIAENIIKDFKDLANGKGYKQITENIHRAIKEEFLELKREADDLFGTALKNMNASDFEDDTEDIVGEEFI